MIDSQFEIKILDLHWVNYIDDGFDLCLHGHCFVKIGDEIISDINSDTWTLSVTGLYLLRTLKNSYDKSYGSQILPCCGHFMLVDKGEKDVLIIGCPNGIDWVIEHLDNFCIKHTSENGTTAIQTKEEFTSMVFEFVNEIEQFYSKSQPRVLPEDESDLQGYNAFWREWKELKQLYKA